MNTFLEALTDDDKENIREGKVVVYAFMEKDGFLTIARTNMHKDNFMSQPFQAEIGTIILDELQTAFKLVKQKEDLQWLEKR